MVLGMLMVDMEVEPSAVAVVVVIGQVGHMELELVLMEDMVQVNLVDMEDMLVVWVLIGESLPLDTQVAMGEALIEVMIWQVITVALVRVMEDMVVVVVVAATMEVAQVAMEVAHVAMTLALVVVMEIVVGAPSLEVEGDMVVQEAVDIILMDGRRSDDKDFQGY